MRFSWLPVAALSGLLSWGGAAQAAEAAAAPLTLAGAVDLALKTRPELAGFQFTQRILSTRQAEAGFRPQPQVEFLVEDALGTGAHRGFDVAQSSLLLSQVVELGGKAAGRSAVVEADGGRLLNEQAAQQLDVVAEVARRYLEVLAGQWRYELAGNAVQIAQAGQLKVEERVKASRAPPAEAARAGVQLWDAKLLVQDAEHELEIARRYLAAAMGEEQVRFGRATGDLLTLPETESFEALASRIAQTPELLRFASEERMRDAEIRLAELQRRADPRLTLGVRRFEQSNDVALVLGITMPLFASRTAQPAIDRARAQRDLAGTSREAQRLKLRAQLFSAFTQLQHEQALSKTLRTELMPRLETALAQATYAYERGRYSYLEWTTAQRELLEGRLRLLESAARFHLLRIEIERLTGTALNAAGETR